MKKKFFTYTENNVTKVKCESHFAGQKLVTIAKCNPEDTFDEEAGRKLADARMEVKVAEKKVNRAYAKMAFAEELMDYAMYVMDASQRYMSDAEDQLLNASRYLDETLEAM